MENMPHLLQKLVHSNSRLAQNSGFLIYQVIFIQGLYCKLSGKAQIPMPYLYHFRLRSNRKELKIREGWKGGGGTQVVRNKLIEVPHLGKSFEVALSFFYWTTF